MPSYRPRTKQVGTVVSVSDLQRTQKWQAGLLLQVIEGSAASIEVYVVQPDKMQARIRPSISYNPDRVLNPDTLVILNEWDMGESVIPAQR